MMVDLLQRDVETKHALFSNLHLALFAWNLDYGRRIPAHQRPTPSIWAKVVVSGLAAVVETTRTALYGLQSDVLTATE